MDEWIKKLGHIYTMKFYSALKKKGNLAICDNMDRPWVCYAKGYKPDRERQILYDLTYMWNLKKQT